MFPKLFFLLGTSGLEWSILSDDNGVISMIRLHGELLLGSEIVLLELLDLAGVDCFRGCSGINTVSLDGDDEPTVDLEEHLSVQGDNSSLIGLGDVTEDAINHTNKHSVLKRLSGILQDRDNIWSLLGHVGQITSRSVGELNSIDATLWSDHVRDVGDGSTVCRTEIEDLGTRADGHLANTSNNCSTELRSEGIPDSVLDLLSGSLRSINLNSLLSVNRFSGNHIQGEHSFILTTGDEHSRESVLFNDDLSCPLPLTLSLALSFAESLSALSLSFSETTLSLSFSETTLHNNGLKAMNFFNQLSLCDQNE